MTIGTSHASQAWTGNGITTKFDFTFYCPDPSQLLVPWESPIPGGGTEADREYGIYRRGIDYTVQLNTPLTGSQTVPQGGTLTFNTPPPSGRRVVAFRFQQILQPTDLIPHNPFPADTVETRLDRLTLMVAENRENLARAYLAPAASETGFGLFNNFPNPVPLRVLSADGDGNLQWIELQSGEYVPPNDVLWVNTVPYNATDLIDKTKPVLLFNENVITGRNDNFASVIKHDTKTSFIIAARFAAHWKPLDPTDAGLRECFGFVSEAWAGDFGMVPSADNRVRLVGGATGIVQQNPQNTLVHVGLDVVFRNRDDNDAETEYYKLNGNHGPAGENDYNRNSRAIQISAQPPSPTGGSSGWDTGIEFTANSLSDIEGETQRDSTGILYDNVVPRHGLRIANSTMAYGINLHGAGDALDPLGNVIPSTNTFNEAAIVLPDSGVGIQMNGSSLKMRGLSGIYADLYTYHICVIGDSLSWAHPWGGIPWPERLELFLGSHGVPCKVTNLALGGMRFDDVYNPREYRYRFGDVTAGDLLKEYQPDMVINALGFNDRRGDADNRNKQIELYTQIKADCPDTVQWALFPRVDAKAHTNVGTGNPVVPGDIAPLNYQVIGAMQVGWTLGNFNLKRVEDLAQLAVRTDAYGDSTTWYDIIRLNELWGDLGTIVPNVAARYELDWWTLGFLGFSMDGLHPSQAGHGVMAGEIASIIKMHYVDNDSTREEDFGPRHEVFKRLALEYDESDLQRSVTNLPRLNTMMDYSMFEARPSNAGNDYSGYYDIATIPDPANNQTNANLGVLDDKDYRKTSTILGEAEWIKNKSGLYDKTDPNKGMIQQAFGVFLSMGSHWTIDLVSQHAQWHEGGRFRDASSLLVPPPGLGSSAIGNPDDNPTNLQNAVIDILEVLRRQGTIKR